MYSRTIQKLIDLFSKFPTVGPRTASRFVFYLLRKPKEETEELIKSISELKEQIKICSFCFNPFDIVRRSLGEGGAELCPICSDPRRDKSLLCVVANETDLAAIEKTKKYQGLYFILGGTVSALKKEELKKLRVKELLERIKDSEIVEEDKSSSSPTEPCDSGAKVKKKEEISSPTEPCDSGAKVKKKEEISSPFAAAQVVKEIIIAINPTTEGEATALYLERLLKPFDAAQGNPIRITRLGRGLPVGGELEYADEETLSSALEGRK